MRTVVYLMMCLSIALGVGFGLSYLALVDRGLFGTFNLGPWVAWAGVGSPEPDPYTRAYVSRTGALQLARAEGVRFIASRDSAGQILDRACTYRIDGNTPVSSFWTLFAVDRTFRIISREDGAMAVNSQRLARANDGTALVRVGPDLSADNWLETAGEGDFRLVLTLYDSSVFSGFGSLVLVLPTILREAC